MTGLVLGFIFLIAFLIRALPFLSGRPNPGIDHWYWRGYIDALKRGEKIPPRMPHYLLEEAQWYPPFFPFLLSKLPSVVFEKYSHGVAIGIDLLRLGFLFITLTVLGLNNPWIYGAAGLLYATTPIVVMYNFQLNPRGLSALFLDIVFVLMVLKGQGLCSPVVFWPVALFLMGLILLTHKMTTQLFLFVLPSLVLFLRAWSLLWLVPGAVLSALLLSRGFYFNVLRAHWDIVTYWTKEWPLLDADPLRASPLYGRKDYQGHLQYEPGVKNFIKKFLSLFLGNYAPVAAGAFFWVLWMPPADSAGIFLAVWFLACLCFAILTLLVPFLRGLGYGNLYLYNATFPATLLFGYAMNRNPDLAKILTVIFLILNAALLIRSFRFFKHHKGMALPDPVLERIRQCGPGAWISFPMQLMEHITYFTGKPVLWGGHGYGFKKLHQIFPILRRDLRELMKEYDLRFILVDESYVQDIRHIPIPKKICYEAEGYQIVELLSSES